jgi:signal transduction histidine kinase
VPRRNLILRTHSALPFVAVIAGVLLAGLALGLAAWSKELTKDAARAECAARAAGLGHTIARVLEQRLEVVAAKGRPPEVIALWMVKEGVIVERWPREVADPPAAWLAEARRAPSARLSHVGERGPQGPRAATWVPQEGGAPKPTGTLARWDLDVLARSTIPEALREAGAEDSRYRAELLTPDVPREAGFRPRAETPLYPPLASWSIGVGYANQSGMRRGLRLQTALLAVLTACLLLVLVACVVLYARGERRRALVARAREAFLARATHELQTPLAVLRAGVETLQRGAVEGADRERCLAIVIREEERVTRTIRRLLRYLSWENADMAAVARWAPVDETLDAALAELGSTLEAAGLSLSVEREALPAEAPADLLRDTLIELLNNARKHAGEGAQVKVCFKAQGSARARLSVEDDGPGIGPNPEALFAPWTQGETSSARAGSGLGLALLREGWILVGGSVRLEPTPKGACFVVDVPLRSTS